MRNPERLAQARLVDQEIGTGTQSAECETADCALFVSAECSLDLRTCSVGVSLQTRCDSVACLRIISGSASSLPARHGLARVVFRTCSNAIAHVDTRMLASSEALKPFHCSSPQHGRF